MKEYVKKQILGAYNPACLLSLIGASSAVVAMILAINSAFDLALVCLILAGLADLFDGVLARKLQRNKYEKEFGVQLDTTVDAVAFIASPAVIALSIDSTSLLIITSVIFYVMAGVVRLAHFNALNIQGVDQSTHHHGLPVTYIALILPVLFLLQNSMTVENFLLLLSLSFTVTGLLFVTNVPVRKPQGIFYIILPLLASVLIMYWTGRYIQSTNLI